MRLSASVCGVVFLLVPALAGAQTKPPAGSPAKPPSGREDQAALQRERQARTAAEDVRAMQAIFATSGSVVISVGRADGVPSAVAWPSAPMPLRANQGLVINNSGDRPLQIRLQAAVETSPPQIAELTEVAPNATSQWSFADLLAITKGERNLLLQPVIASALGRTESVLPAGFFLLEGGEPASLEEADKAIQNRIRAAQGALRVEDVKTSEIRLALTTAGPHRALAFESLPLELKVQEGVSFRNTTDARLRLAFLNDRQERLTTPAVELDPDETYSLSFEQALQVSGADRRLPFEVVRLGAAGQEELLGASAGHLQLPPGVLGLVTIPLDVTGIGDWRLLNPRSAQRITDETTLEFVTRVPGRTFTVTFPAIKRDLQDRFKEAGFEVNCVQRTTCTPVLQVQAAPRTVGGALLNSAYGAEHGLVQFTVAFFEADIEPANPTGSVRVGEGTFEPGFTSALNLTAFVGVQRDAYFEGFLQDQATKSPIIDAEHPFADQHRTHLAGNVRLIVRQQLGTRASGELELVVKDKDFGALDPPTVTAPKARVNVFGLNGFILSLGRFDVALPTRSLAIAQSGEGVSGRFRWLHSSFIVRPRDPSDVSKAAAAPQTAPALVPALPSAKDRWSTVTQLQFSPGPLRVESSVLVGRRETYSGGEGLYFTYGGDLLAAGGLRKAAQTDGRSEQQRAVDKQLEADNAQRASYAAWRASLGAYRSYRQARASDVQAPDGDRGWGFLADANIATLAAGRPRFTFGATWAVASADDPATPHDEGYVGESSAFVPDRIFLASLAPKLAALQLPTADAGGQARRIKGGIFGKSYYSGAVIWQGFSPLEWLLFIARVPSSDVGIKSTTFRWHGYSLRTPVPPLNGSPDAKSFLGQEALVEFLLESPKGVRYALTGSGFFPGELLKSQRLVLQNTWSLDARVTVTLR